MDRIGQVAQLLGIKTHVIRYWEREFPHLRPSKNTSGQRIYSPEKVKEIQRIHRLLHVEGFTIAGAKKYLQAHEQGEEREGALIPKEMEGSLLRIQEEIQQFLEELEEKFSPPC
ncbi:MerR family transcriptional regulator [Pajaroellobacter abortibovis]|uniref:HTH merR-type domain-containing protein n=1 Tax=Pajaroellobacter abortibovis TaxID=1882918 RepID=A0A1L6MWI1_9BACT|nr:MerR family transcriptional regulator [Pajaroellobacter abortibovis]APR99814.1 hypothetical protein BCY86_03320 [Pajaroellobacter abortibovis]